MTAAEMSLLDLHSGWTTDDLDAMPESHRRYEIIDGALIVPPSPTDYHQSLAGILMVLLRESCPPGFKATQGVEVRVSHIRSFTPDVLVTTTDGSARRTPRFAPHEVVLAVEIVSPGSVTMDRITKPALYAEAGIPCYWRIELDPSITVHTHRLDAASGVYRPTGEFAETVSVDEPWPVSFPISRITP